MVVHEVQLLDREVEAEHHKKSTQDPELHVTKLAALVRIEVDRPRNRDYECCNEKE